MTRALLRHSGDDAGYAAPVAALENYPAEIKREGAREDDGMEPRKRRHAPLTGIVLSGGGARGAHEAGVIKYIRDELPPRVRAHARFEIVTGTSVGAINACF